MSDAIIKVENVSKRYQIGSLHDSQDALRHRIEAWMRNPWGRLKTLRAERGDATKAFWALKDVSFEIKQGEVVGFIGRNGAGKSTLLKILSRITEPTEGRVRMLGRVASLLEVGTGFHQELTGRENIFLNGAILGMSRDEIARKFDEIVAFSEVEAFLDTPVKRYSSGMYVRLAFAVAAHLEPEILIVDEVLAVGDVQFQKKCLGKMGEVAKTGRTVLFVSHNMSAVKSLCSQAVILRQGRMIMHGPVSTVLSKYFQSETDVASEKEWADPTTAPGNEHLRLKKVGVYPPAGHDVITVDSGADVQIEFSNVGENINLDCTIYVSSGEGVLLFETCCIISTEENSKTGHYRVKGLLPRHLLNSGRYVLTFLFGKDQRYLLYRWDEGVSFTIENTNTGRGRNDAAAPGLIRPLITWDHEFLGNSAGQKTESVVPTPAQI